MFYLPYKKTTEGEFFDALANAINHTLADCHFYINEKFGSGSVRIVRLEDGLAIRKWDCILNETVQINTQPIHSSEYDYTLSYCLTPNAIVFKNAEAPGVQTSKVWDSVLFSRGVKLKMEILPETAVKCFSICFTQQWLENHTDNNNETQKKFLKKILCHQPWIFLLEACNGMERQMLDDIFNNKPQQGGTLFLKSRVFTALNEFISKIARRPWVDARFKENIYEHAVRSVERKMMDMLCGSLPGIKQLARDSAMSESILRLNFKKVFGTTLTDYYLDKKMNYAKQLIEEKNKTVTETAYVLGYEKVSHFIAMFKKRVGYSPGAFRRAAS